MPISYIYLIFTLYLRNVCNITVYVQLAKVFRIKYA